MQEVFGLEPLHKGQKGGKSLMTAVCIIPQTQRGCMGKQDIEVSSTEYTVEQQVRYHLQYPEGHLALGELVPAFVVSHRPTKASYDKLVAFVIDNFSIDKIPPKGRKQLHVPFCVSIAILHN